MSSERCNLLLTIAGAKAYLVPIFESNPLAGRIVVADADPHAAALGVTNLVRTVPMVSAAERYIEALCAIVTEESIHGIVPQNDIDLQLIAEKRAELEAAGAVVFTTAPEIVRAVTDKLALTPWLAEYGLHGPRSAEPAQARERGLTFPLIAKARFGQGSAGLARVDDEAALARVPADCIVQERLEGTEYNLDILCDRDGEVTAVVPKQKLAMRFGSTDKARSVEAPDLLQLGVRIGRAVGQVGAIDVDVMLTATGPYILDINPRVGGGFPFTATFCPEYVTALLQIARGEVPDSLLGRYARDVVVYRDFQYLTRRS